MRLSMLCRKAFSFTKKKTLLCKCLRIQVRTKASSTTDVEYQRTIISSIGNEFGVKKLDDWYNIPIPLLKQKADFIRNEEAFINCLKMVYPQHNWDPLKITKVPRDYLLHRNELEKIGLELGIKTLNDWYNVSLTPLREKAPFIKHYGSFIEVLKKFYPQHEWDPLCFASIPKGFWNNEWNQRESLERIGKEFGVKTLDDWYSVPVKQVREIASFIKYYDSFIQVLRKFYPQHEWDPLRFNCVPKGFWHKEANQRFALDRFGKQLGVEKLDDWYHIPIQQLTKKASFITKYGSAYNLMKRFYPQHEWDPLQFSGVSKGFWQQEHNRNYYRDMLTKIKNEHNIKHLKDWYQLPPKMVQTFQRVAHGAFGSVTKMLKEWFPDTNWSDQVHSSAPELSLQWMMSMVVDDIRVHHKIGKHSVDVYIPQWNLALEYQGIQHFKQTAYGDLQRQLNRDKIKHDELKQNVNLVTIPHLWNGTWSQLKATIRHSLPHVNTNMT